MWGFPEKGVLGLRTAGEMGFQGAEISLGSFEEHYPMSDENVQENTGKSVGSAVSRLPRFRWNI